VGVEYILMAKEADFYSPAEAAKALGVPESRIFGMLSSGQLEGRQDEWARWWISASAVSRARQDSEPSPGPDISNEEDAGSLAAGDEARDNVVAAPVHVDRDPLQKPSTGADMPSGEETIGAEEMPLRDERRQEPEEQRQPPHDAITGSSDAETTTERLPHVSHRETATLDVAFNETVRELTERLATVAAKVGELRARLELTEVSETTLRESLERERQRADRESARAERERKAVERLEEELRAERNKGFWKRLFGG
jgi:hypothetical protein